MGKSKKKQGGGPAAANKVFCYWCDKDFAGEELLIQHQIAKHFRCKECKVGNAGKCINLECLVIHYRKVHRAELLAVPNAKEGRTDPAESQHIYGLAGVPEEILEEWCVRDPMAPDPTPLPAAAPEPSQFQTPASSAPAMGLGAMPGLPQADPAASGVDLAKQVQMWMQLSKAAAVEEPPPPLPQSRSPSPPSRRSTSHLDPVKPQQTEPERTQSFQQFPSNSFQGFSVGSAGSRPAVDSAAAGAIASTFAQNAQLSAAAANFPSSAPSRHAIDSLPLYPAGAEPQKPFIEPQFAKPSFIEPQFASYPHSAQPKGNRSRSRDRRSRSRDRRGRSRSRSRGRNRSRSRRGDDRNRPRDTRPSYRPAPGSASGGGGKGGGGGGGGGSGAGTEDRTIQIIEGTIRSRLQLKGEMEKFGQVETVYMGNRHDPKSDPPMVRFTTANSAKMAHDAVNACQVVFDGMPAKAEFKKGGRRPIQRDIEREVDNNLHISSRDFAREDRRRPDRWAK